MRPHPHPQKAAAISRGMPQGSAHRAWTARGMGGAQQKFVTKVGGKGFEVPCWPRSDTLPPTPVGPSSFLVPGQKRTPAKTSQRLKGWKGP